MSSQSLPTATSDTSANSIKETQPWQQQLQLSSTELQNGNLNSAAAYLLYSKQLHPSCRSQLIQLFLKHLFLPINMNDTTSIFPPISPPNADNDSALSYNNSKLMPAVGEKRKVDMTSFKESSDFSTNTPKHLHSSNENDSSDSLSDNENDNEELIDETTPAAKARFASYAHLSNDIACGLCKLFMYRPVTIICGHSFCQVCLQAYIDRTPQPRCPVSNCNECLTPDCSRQICIVLANALERCFPTEYSLSKIHSEAISAIQVGNDEIAVQLLTEAINQWPNAFALYSSRLCCNLRLCKFEMAKGDMIHCAHLLELLPQHCSNELIIPAPHQSSHMLHTLTALGQAGLITRVYSLAINAFSSALRLSSSTNSGIDRERVAQRLVDAYVGEIHKTVPKPLLANSITIEPESLSTFHLVDPFSIIPSTIPLPSTFLISSLITRNISNAAQDRINLKDEPTTRSINEEFQCILCMGLLYEPVTTICGHTFCRLCLARSLDHKNQCPACRETLSVHISPTRQSVNVTIAAVLQRWCKDEYEKRHKSCVAELAQQSQFLPLFVCTLLFPGVSCPLHIFEPKYRLMIRSVLESGYNRMGMCIATNKGTNYSTIGCTAEIRNVRLLPDGRSLVDTVGGRRFTIVKQSTHNGYDTAEIEWLDDLSDKEQADMFANADPPLSTLISDVREVVNDVLLPRMLNQVEIESQLGVMPSMDSPTEFAYWLCAILPLPVSDKYEFLQLRTQYERYQRLQSYMAEIESKEFC